ncbi:hypothetical protein H8711_03940 [Clostridiaceae bacterium NSJ-31]|uniref:Uncharacterized protein n=1 Tax=Ligaoa zhengdingensis TaxID=2763658 RepID=A0A926DXT5_9FIRM|nr:hypothetical protein [Ligaoa zhengdingensis]MBC8546086.1 hypothetical protein [Ligaoa zhengdingensis]
MPKKVNYRDMPHKITIGGKTKEEMGTKAYNEAFARCMIRAMFRARDMGLLTEDQRSKLEGWEYNPPDE